MPLLHINSYVVDLTEVLNKSLIEDYGVNAVDHQQIIRLSEYTYKEYKFIAEDNFF